MPRTSPRMSSILWPARMSAIRLSTAAEQRWAGLTGAEFFLGTTRLCVTHTFLTHLNPDGQPELLPSLLPRDQARAEQYTRLPIAPDLWCGPGCEQTERAPDCGPQEF